MDSNYLKHRAFQNKGVISILMLLIFSNISTAQIVLMKIMIGTLLAVSGGIKARIIDPINGTDDTGL
jgi:hypothetical protein